MQTPARSVLKTVGQRTARTLIITLLTARSRSWFPATTTNAACKHAGSSKPAISPHLRLEPKAFHSGGTSPGSASSFDLRLQTYIIRALWALWKQHIKQEEWIQWSQRGEQKTLQLLAPTTTISDSYNTTITNIPRTRHSRWSLDEFAIEMLNYGLTLLCGLHSRKHSQS